MSAYGGDWTASLHTKEGSRFRLICFPHAGGSAGAFFPLSAAAPASVEVVAVQYPGRQWRRSEPALTDIHELARGVADAVLTMNDLPTAFLGTSMGALVAFETVRLVEAEQPEKVAHLFASASGAPSFPRAEARRQRWSEAELIGELRRLGGTGELLLADEEALRMHLPALRNDYRALASYSCGPQVTTGVPIAVLVGRDDPTTNKDAAGRWRSHTRSNFSVQEFPGGHFFVTEHPQKVLETVVGHLDPIALHQG
ncbi:thioesterase II family protein [Streptomyces sp. NPDC052236]|uniref:thioesterase II family protein n=1 Tax=Streptomyces sp. NPDC052236 TaxID=3365686 RepID=UPI0037D472FF